jgi:hypothetical protein
MKVCLQASLSGVALEARVAFRTRQKMRYGVLLS